MAKVNLKVNNATKARNRILGIILALAVVVFVSIMVAISSAETKKTIDVVKIKQGNPISANSIITEDMVERYPMYYREFEQYGTEEKSDGSVRSTIVRWADKDNVLGQRYAAYYLRDNTVLFWDSTIVDQTRKNSYLYNMSGELLNIQMETTKDFGDMVVPGDSLNIRATYTYTNYDLPTEEAYVLSGGSSTEGAEETKIEPLFSEVTILDMLNSDGSSIFDIYYEYMAASKTTQQELLKDKSFLKSVQPKSILLECTAEEVEHYMQLQSYGATYQMTLLPRTGSSSMTESLSEIQTALAGIAGLGE